MDVSLGLEGTHVLITGGAGLIGRKVVDAFLSAGANVTSLDISYGPGHHSTPTHSDLKLQTIYADIASEKSIEDSWAKAEGIFGTVECCVALASLDLSVLRHVESLADMELGQFQRTWEVNVGGTFLTGRSWLRGLRNARSREATLNNVGFIIIGSESGHFGERMNPDYASTKSAVQGGLLQSLKMDAPRVWEGSRVNAVAPGPVDTPRFREECRVNKHQYYLDCQGTTALGEPVPMEAVAKTVLFLASKNFSGHVHGQVLNVDSGKLGKVAYMEGELK